MSEDAGTPAAGETAPADAAMANDLAAAMESGATPTDPDVLDIDALGDIGARLVRMKIDGEDQTLDLASALKGTQRFKAATVKEMRAAEAIRAKEAEVVGFFKDPAKFLERGGVEAVESVMKFALSHSDPRVQEAAERALNQVMEESAMAPEQREQRKRESTLEKRERELAERESVIAEENLTRAATEHRARFEASFSAALTAGGMPVDGRHMAAMAKLTQLADERGVELKPEEAVAILAEERGTTVKSSLASLTGGDLLRALGPEIVRAVNLAYLEQHKRGQPQQTRAPSAPNKPANGATKRVDMDALRLKMGLR